MFETLFEIIENRKKEKPAGSYTQSLFSQGEDHILRKIGEETLEVILGSKSEGEHPLIEESADLIYHLFVLLSFKNITPDQVKNELLLRHQKNRDGLNSPL